MQHESGLLTRDDMKEAPRQAELVISLSDITHLFNAPPINPLSGSTPEALGISGVEYLLNRLHMNRTMRRVRTLILELPVKKISPALEDETARALHRHAELRLERERRELCTTRRYGWLVLGIALCLLVVFLGLSSLFTNELTAWMRPLTRKTFEYGFEIIGWVLMWHPIEVLFFSPLAIRARIRALKALASFQVVVRAESAHVGSAATASKDRSSHLIATPENAQTT